MSIPIRHAFFQIMKKYTKVLAIAGSEPLGSAGIQADIKSISACGCYACGAVTVVVNEDTMHVKGIHPIPVPFVLDQVHSVIDDIGVEAIKIGMLLSTELVTALAAYLPTTGLNNIVLDPVMVNSKGDTLFKPDAIEAVKKQLIPCARIITPNIKEGELLLGDSIRSQADMGEALARLAEMYHCSIVLKAGFFKNDPLLTDLLWDAEQNKVIPLPVPCVKTKNINGTGCSFSSAIASFMAKGLGVEASVREAKHYIHTAISEGADYEFGKGFGPVNHFYMLREK